MASYTRSKIRVGLVLHILHSFGAYGTHEYLGVSLPITMVAPPLSCADNGSIAYLH